ncbi:hypothetical protein [Candidatus Electronema sp. PJ]|uniref:hypothetical protein n=1 Tax=Candidatus Electronema sp. PJ TaxID=3401572 RepID=UPI003AA7D985
MRKKTIQSAFGLALACLAGVAWAGGPGPMGMVPSNSVPGNMGMDAAGLTAVPGVIGANPSYGSPMMPGGIGMGGSPGNVGMPMLDLRQVVMQGMRSLPQQQRDQLGMNMAYQNMQGMGSGMSPFNQIRNSVRDSIMMSRVADISRMGQSTFRPMIQPGAVQSMISQIQPWNFPSRFQSGMMPMMIPILSAPIKQQQMAYMQYGIMNNPGFPNVPLPMPGYSPYNNGGMMNGGYPSSGGGYGTPPGGMGMGGGYPYGGGGMPGGMGMMGGMGMGGYPSYYGY